MPPEISTLVVDLESPDPVNRCSAAERLCQLGKTAHNAAVALAVATGDGDEAVAEWATAALEELGPPPADDCPRLAVLLEGSPNSTAYWAATLLGRLGAAAEASVPQLAAALEQHTCSDVKHRAAWALGKVGPPATLAVDALQEAANSDNSRLARLALRALKNIDG